MTVRADIAPADARRSRASDPAASVFVAANAGSGKTKTLVDRVARLLLAGARPEAILCVTYTKAAAAEMQRRLFEELGDWAVMADEHAGARRCAELDEPARDLRPRPRAVRPRPGDARRPEDPDHPRLLREAAEALPAGGRRLAGLHGAGGRRRARRSRPRRARTWRWPRSTVPTARSARPTATSRSSSTTAASTTCSPPSRPSARAIRAYVEACGGRAARRRHLAPLRLRRADRRRGDRGRGGRRGSAGASGGAPPRRCWPATAATDQRLRPGDAARRRRLAVRRGLGDLRHQGRRAAQARGAPRRSTRGPRSGWPREQARLGEAVERAQGRPDRRGQRPRDHPGAAPTPSSTTAPRTRCGRSTSAT